MRRRAALLALFAAGVASTPHVLPLRRTELSHSAASSLRARRALGAAGEAQVLPLFGSVRDNGVFTVEVFLGTPPQRFDVIVDTGSTLFYVPCHDCGSGCGRHEDAYFNPDVSASYHAVPCASATCAAYSARCQFGACSYVRSYAEQSSSAGRLVVDSITLGGLNGSVVFGCETRETGEILRQAADGIIGFGRGTVSVMAQLAAQAVTPDVFALCYGSWGPAAGVTGAASANGALLLGALPAGAARRLQRTPLVSAPAHPSYYTVKLLGVALNGSDIAAHGSGVAASYGVGFGTVLDSGTTFIYLPSPAFAAFQGALRAALPPGTSPVPGPDAAFSDVCYALPGASVATLAAAGFPSLTLSFENATLALPPDNYLFAWGDARPDTFCVGVFDNGSAGVLLGAIMARNVVIQYDRVAGALGFAPANCTAVMRRGLAALDGAGEEAPSAEAQPSPPPYPAQQASPPRPPRPPPVGVRTEGGPPLVLSLELHGANLQLYGSPAEAAAELRSFLARGLGLELEQVSLTDLAACVPAHACGFTASLYGLAPANAAPGDAVGTTAPEAKQLLIRKEVHLASPLGKLILVKVVADPSEAGAPPAPPTPGAPPGFVALLVLVLALALGGVFAAIQLHLKDKGKGAVAPEPRAQD